MARNYVQFNATYFIKPKITMVSEGFTLCTHVTSFVREPSIVLENIPEIKEETLRRATEE